MFGDRVVDEGVEFEVIWTGAADCEGVCFCLTSSRNQRHDVRLDAKHETLAGEPFKPRGISVAKLKP